MSRMISTIDVSIIRQVGDLKNQGIVDHWNSHKFLVVDISSNRNQCLQYSLNAFYHDINKKLRKPLFFSWL